MKIGEKIKRLRMKHNLTQEELADRCELTKGFISQVERELTSPSIATLVDILSPWVPICATLMMTLRRRLSSPRRKSLSKQMRT